MRKQKLPILENRQPSIKHINILQEVQGLLDFFLRLDISMDDIIGNNTLEFWGYIVIGLRFIRILRFILNFIWCCVLKNK